MSGRQTTGASDHPRHGEDRDAGAAGDGGAGLVFWWLITMAVAGFAPCMILPAWREYQQAELTERVRAAEVATTAAEVKHLRRRLNAVHNDPAVVTRLARRELAFRRPGEVLIAVPVASAQPGPATHAPVAQANALTPVEPPLPLARLVAYLPNLNYDALFCRSPMRETILTMSVGLFVAAFVVFWPRRRAAE